MTNIFLHHLEHLFSRSVPALISVTPYQALPEFYTLHLFQKKIPFTEGTLGNAGLVLVLSQLILLGQSGVQLYVQVVKQGISDISILDN